MSKFKTQILFALSTIVLCFVLMVSTTLALFESEQSAGGRVNSGSLEVVLCKADENGKYEDISSGSGNIFGDGLWQSGTSRVVFFKVENKSSIAIKVAFSMILDGEDFGGNLLYCGYEGEYFEPTTLEWNSVTATNTPKAAELGENSILGESYTTIAKDGELYFTLVLHLDEEMNDKYQDKEAKIDVRLDATQANNGEV